MATTRDNRRIKNPRYKDGRTLVDNRCPDCNKKIDYRSTRCAHCSAIKQFKDKGHPFTGRKHTQETKDKLSKARYIHGKRPNACPDCGKDKYYRSKRCLSCNAKKLHRDNIFNYNRKPNKPENKLIKLLNKILPKEYKYVGDGQIRIDTFNPDFINCNGQKKIIECYGDYWHNKPDELERNKRRIKAYKKYGYKTLIIWEKELKDLDKLQVKIREFN